MVGIGCNGSGHADSCPLFPKFSKELTKELTNTYNQVNAKSSGKNQKVLTIELVPGEPIEIVQFVDFPGLYQVGLRRESHHPDTKILLRYVGKSGKISFSNLADNALKEPYSYSDFMPDDRIFPTISVFGLVNGVTDTQIRNSTSSDILLSATFGEILEKTSTILPTTFMVPKAPKVARIVQKAHFDICIPVDMRDYPDAEAFELLTTRQQKEIRRSLANEFEKTLSPFKLYEGVKNV